MNAAIEHITNKTPLLVALEEVTKNFKPKDFYTMRAYLISTSNIPPMEKHIPKNEEEIGIEVPDKVLDKGEALCALIMEIVPQYTSTKPIDILVNYITRRIAEMNEIERSKAAAMEVNLMIEQVFDKTYSPSD